MADDLSEASRLQQSVDDLGDRVKDLGDQGRALGSAVEATDVLRKKDIRSTWRLTLAVLFVAVVVLVVCIFSLYGNIQIHGKQTTNGRVLNDLTQLFDPHSQISQTSKANTAAIEAAVEACDANTYLRISEAQHNRAVASTHVGAVEAIDPPLANCATYPLP